MTAEAVPIAFVRACEKCIKTKQDCPSLISLSKAKEARFPHNLCSSCLFLFLLVSVCVFCFVLNCTDLSLVCFQVFLLSDADLRACPSVKVDSYMLFTKKDTSSNGASGSAAEPKQMSVRKNELFLLDSLFYCSSPSLFFLSRQRLLKHTQLVLLFDYTTEALKRLLLIP